MPASKLFIDADAGIGTALAVTAALLDDELDVVGLSGVAGRFDADTATTNLQSILALLDPPKWPRLGQGTGEACVPSLDGFPDATALHGPVGLGEFEGYDVEPADRIEAAKLLIDLVRQDPNEITLLTLGPLTNVHHAMQLYPELLSQLREIVVLGGWVTGGGDATPAADLNIYADAEAARAVLTAAATTILVPLDVCRGTTMTLDQLDRLPLEEHTRLGRLLGQLLPYWFRAHHEHLGRESIRLDELVALAVVRHPEFFETQRLVADVETQGQLTRGMVVFDRRPGCDDQPNLEVAMKLDSQSVRQYLVSLLQGDDA